MIPNTSELEDMGVWAWSLDITDLNWEINCIFFRFKWSEQGVDVLSVVSCKGSLWILNFKDSEIVVILIKSFESSSVNLIFQFGDTQVLDLNWVSNCPLKSDWSCR